MDQKSVANLCFSTAWGGLEMSTVKMTRLFAAAGHSSVGICQPQSPIHRALEEQGLPSVTTHMRTYFSPTATRTIRSTIDTKKLDALFLHQTKDIWLATPALWGRPNVKMFAFARMFIRGVSKKDPLHTLMYSRLTAMIALSHAQKKLLLECLPVPEDKYIVIPNGVDTQRFKPGPKRHDLREQWGVKPEHVLFGLIGRLDPQKGSLEFVEAAGQTLLKHPNARFVLVGGNTLGEGEFDRKVRDTIRDLDLTDKVILTDFRKDIPDVMNALDAFVMPSYEENFANVMLEALAAGLPCIGTNSGGTPEILSFGETGLLCEPKSSASLAKTMQALAGDSELRAVLSQRARSKAEREYEMSKVFARIEALV